MPYAQTLTEFYNTHPYTPIHSPTAGAWAAEQTHGKIFSLPLPDDDIQVCSSLANVVSWSDSLIPYLPLSMINVLMW